MKFNKVFIFSTGRCGSQSIVESMKCDRIYAVHEPVPILVKENILHYLDKISNTEYYVPHVLNLLEASRDEKIQKINKEGRIYLESSHFLSTFIKELYELYPDALFIHLIRDGREVVRSGINKGWYKHISLKDMTCTTQCNTWGASVWKSPIYCNSQITYACHYWKSQNQMIRYDFTFIPDEQQLVIKLEDNNLKPLCDKLQIDEKKWTVSNKMNGQALSFKDWSVNDKKIGMDIMGDMLKYYGY